MREGGLLKLFRGPVPWDKEKQAKSSKGAKRAAASDESDVDKEDERILAAKPIRLF